MSKIKIIIKRLTFHSIKKRGFLAFNNFKSHITNDDLSYVLQYDIGSLGSHIQGEKMYIFTSSTSGKEWFPLPRGKSLSKVQGYYISIIYFKLFKKNI